MSIILWPRQEVLQLVIPELGVVGRVLNANTAINVIRKLTKYQSTEGKISFDRWLIVAKDVLRWNDNCIQLFWDMASLSTYYMHKDVSGQGKNEVILDLQYLAIFIILHLNDDSSMKPLSPASGHTTSVVYDDTWPTASVEDDRDLMVATTGGSLGSPKRDNNSSNRNRSKQTPTSPISPKSAHATSAIDIMAASANISALPPGVNAHSFKSSAQYLHSVKQKIPLILRALCIEQHEELDATMTDLTLSIDASLYADVAFEGFHQAFSRNEFFVSKRTVDALGLIICGGLSRDQSVPYLSSLFPVFQSADNDVAMRSSGDLDDLISLSAQAGQPSISFSELSSSINAHISMNDTFYPVSTVPVNGTSDSSKEVGDHSADDRTGSDTDYSPCRVQQPVRLVNSLSLLTRSVPTVINWSSTTTMHVVSSSGGLSRPSSFRRQNSRSSRSLGSVDFDSLLRAGTSTETPSSPIGNASVSSIGGDCNMHTSPGKSFGRSLSKSFSFKLDTNLPLTGAADDNYSPRSNSNSDYATDSVTEAESFGMLIRKIGSPIEFMLPPLYLNFCTEARLYLISPYHSASIRNCSDCDIVIGAVHGAVIVSHCESVRITVACRKLLIMDCTNCAFNIATLTTTVVSGDTRNVLIGPYNTAYKNLRNHLILAGLQTLCCPLDNENGQFATDLTINNISDADGVDANTGGDNHRNGADGISGPDEMLSEPSPSPDVLSNCWSSLCDVSSCLEGPPLFDSSPTGGYEAVDVLPPPLPDTARLQPLDDFQLISIPFKNEYDTFDHCPIATPREYKESLEQRRQVAEQIKSQLASIFESSHPHANATEEELKKRQLAANAAISKKFMEWLVRSGNAKQVLDLVRIDGERFGLSAQGGSAGGSQATAKSTIGN